MGFWLEILKFKKFRRSIVINLKSAYYHEIGNCIPLNNDYEAHLLENDAHNSFSEIFIQREYENFIPKIKFHRILDIGANYGYFSLWLQAKYPESKISSLMIEASPRCRRSLQNLVNQPILDGRFHWLERAIGPQKKKTVDLFDRPYMASSTFENSDDATSLSVKVLKNDEITNILSPPYDIIKCDIEGSEWDFVNEYSEIIKQCKYLLLEWHSWHSGGGGLSQLVENLEAIGFKTITRSAPIPAVGRKGEVGLILCKNTGIES
jgi:FkbM family methyltransferase